MISVDRLLIVTSTPGVGGASAEAAALAGAAAALGGRGAALLIDLAGERPPRGTILATAAARDLAAGPALAESGAAAAARGRIAVACPGPGAAAGPVLAAGEASGMPRVVNVPPGGFHEPVSYTHLTLPTILRV